MEVSGPARVHHGGYQFCFVTATDPITSRVAKSYNSDQTQERFGHLIQKAHDFILANISSIGVDFIDPSEEKGPSSKSIRVLDYACGPGTITNILAGRATEFIGLDISPNMVAEYNERFSSTGSDLTTGKPKLNAQAFNANLFDPAGPPDSVSDAKFFDFDLAAVGFGFHHFENLPVVTQRLVDRLAPGGVLMILDFYSHDKDDHITDEGDVIQTIAHHGFTEKQIKGLFADAGLEDNLVLSFPEDVLMMGRAKRRPFMARGRKPLSLAS